MIPKLDWYQWLKYIHLSFGKSRHLEEFSMLVIIVKIFCCSKKKFSRDLGSPDSCQLLQLQLFSQFFKNFGPSLLILSFLVLLVSWTRLFLCYKFGFSWDWIEFNCLQFSEDEWSFFVYECFWLWSLKFLTYGLISFIDVKGHLNSESG